jgi:hypothetical protein
MKGLKMRIMGLLILAAFLGILCQHRETKSMIKLQVWVLVVVGLASCSLAAGLALGGYV